METALAFREAMLAVDYTFEGVAEMLQEHGHAALQRNETVPGFRRTAGGSPVETLIRLFLLQRTVPVAAVELALPGLLGPLSSAGVIVESGGEVRALLECRPYATDSDLDLWVVSDLTPGLDGGPNLIDAGHVLGISPASVSLAQLTLRADVGSALDLGTGCGVQSLHLAQHSSRVVATDVNPRALELTRFNVALNELSGVEVRAGSLFEPVAGERFDLIATNPPFVISPADRETLIYRDSGLPGDQVVERIVRGAPGLLNPGGWCQILANWAIRADQPWDARLSEWLSPDCDALVVQRETLDPSSYVELWLKDAGLHGAPDYVQRYDDWLGWFESQGIEAIGFGWLNLHRVDQPGRHVLLDWPYEVEQPIAPAIGEWADAVRTDFDADTRLVRRVDVRQETVGPPGAEDPETIVLRQQRGFRRARQADTVVAALVGACDGELSVGQILDAVAQLTDQDAASLRATHLPIVRELVDEGFLEPTQG